VAGGAEGAGVSAAACVLYSSALWSRATTLTPLMRFKVVVRITPCAFAQESVAVQGTAPSERGGVCGRD
jgi:hypothetical protein